MKDFYPEAVSRRFHDPKKVGASVRANAAGTDASFACGCFVRFRLDIDPETKQVKGAAALTNGCGFMIAAADTLAETVEGKCLTDLHGSGDDELTHIAEAELGPFPQERRHCLATPIAALHAAFADFRSYLIEEFQGETALICTCFGVSEATVAQCIADIRAETVEQVTETCRAGGGCGSCRMLIAEMIDIARSGPGIQLPEERKSG